MPFKYLPRFLRTTASLTIAAAALALAGCGSGSNSLITTFAGTGVRGNTGDGGLASSAQLKDPTCIALDLSGNLYIGDYGTYTIRKVDATTGRISTYAGNGKPETSGDGVPATQAKIYFPESCAVSAAGDLYFTDQGYSVVRKVDHTTGIITTIAGIPYYSPWGDGTSTGDGAPATKATLNHPEAIAFKSNGDLVIGGYPYIRVVDSKTGIISTVAGNGDLKNRYSGDGGPATSAGIGEVMGIAFDSSDNIYFTDYTNAVIRKIDSHSGIISTVAGSGRGPDGPVQGLNGPALEARLTGPHGITLGGDGNLYVADAGSACHVLRVSLQTGLLTNAVGKGGCQYGGDGGAATSAYLHEPWNITFDTKGSLYIADTYNAVVRQVTRLY